MAAKPYYTSRSLIDAVKRKIMFPINQATFTDDDVLAFCNEEMMISQVPAVMQYHEEYFVTYQNVALSNNMSRYSVPKRAIGMKLRDINFVDSNNNYYEMTRIDVGDKAFFQQTGSQAPYAHKFYMEGNDVVLSPGITTAPSGSLQLSYYLRPNQLVIDDKSATIHCFENKITLDNDFIADETSFTFNNVIYTARTGSAPAITGISAADNSVITTASAHKLQTGQLVTISGSDSLPSVDGTFAVTVIDSTSFSIAKKVGTAGSTGAFVCKNHFTKGATSTLSASALVSAMTSVGDVHTASNGTPASAIVTVGFTNVDAAFSTADDLAYGYDNTIFGVRFDSLPTSYTNPITNQTETLFTVGGYVDFLQTDPGHRTYAFDARIQSISSTTAYFTRSDLEIFTNSYAIKKIANLTVGDYMCRANECIIPQIPPELHTGLAERTAARILAAIGDREGLAVQQQKIAEVQLREGNLIDDRTESATKKILPKHSHLRMFKSGRRRSIF